MIFERIRNRQQVVIDLGCKVSGKAPDFGEQLKVFFSEPILDGSRVFSQSLSGFPSLPPRRVRR